MSDKKPFNEADVNRDDTGRFAAEPGGRGAAFLSGSGLEDAATLALARGKALGREVLVAVTAGGKLEAEDGDLGSVDGKSVLMRLQQGEAMALVHNHPHGLPLAPNDVGLLEFPGLSAIVAVGHDGSSYMASRGEAFDPNGFAAERRRVEATTGAAATRAGLDGPTAALLRQHADCLALARLGAIDYRFELSEAGAEVVRAHAKVFKEMVDGAVSASRHAAHDHAKFFTLLNGVTPLEEKNNAAGVASKQKALEKLVDSFDWATWAAKVKPAIDKAITASMNAQAKKVAEDLGIVFNNADPFLQTALTKYVVERVTSLEGVTKADVKALIRARLNELANVGGEGPGSPLTLGDAIRDSVRKKFKGYADWRADRIARTETAIAYNHGTTFAARQAGVKQMLVSDGDNDAHCKAVDGTTQTLGWCLNNPTAHPNCTRAFSPVPIEDFILPKAQAPTPSPAPAPPPPPPNKPKPAPGTVAAPPTSTYTDAWKAAGEQEVFWTVDGWKVKPAGQPTPPLAPEPKTTFGAPHTGAPATTDKGKSLPGTLHAPAWADEVPRAYGPRYERGLQSKYTDWYSTLPREQRRAIRAYTANSYNDMNRVLQGISPRFADKADIQREIGHMRKAFESAPPMTETVVSWRGLKNVPNRDAWVADNFPVGKPIRLDGFQSTSVDPDFARNWSHGGVLLEFNSRRGIYVEGFTANEGEHEWILDHGKAYQVVGHKVIKLKTKYDGYVEQRVIQLIELDGEQPGAHVVKRPTKSDPAMAAFSAEDATVSHDKFMQALGGIVAI